MKNRAYASQHNSCALTTRSIAVCIIPLWNSPILPCVIVFNTIIHALVDHLKCNEKILNLVQDQLLHLAQIAITATLM